MINLDDMTLEELQQLALTASNVDKKDPNAVRRLQEISGLTGKDVDGIWGPKSLNTWNESISQATDDEQRFQDAMARGQKSPAVEDILGYSEQLDEQNNYRNAKIQQLEQQIEMVKARIARNIRTLTGKSYDDVNNQLAALEMKKINSQDPSMLWRWQNQRQDAMHANDVVNTNTANKFANDVAMWNTTRLPEGTAAREQMISNLNSTIRDGRNAGADVSDLLTLKAKWEKITYGNDTNSSVNYGVGSETEQLAGLLKTALDTAKTSVELEQFKKDHPDLKADQLSSIDTKIAELKKKENANADEAAVKNWYENMYGKGSWSQIPESVKATYRNVYRDENGVK